MRRRAFLHGMAGIGAVAALVPPWRPGGALAGRHVARLDGGWRFLRGDPAGAERPDFDDAAWAPATLPHTARIEALVTGPAGSPEAQWQGICWYRLPLRLGPEIEGRRVLLRFEGAMNVAEVWLDGRPLGGHRGGYLPFVLDLTDRVEPGGSHLLAVRLDNRDDPITGPKPMAQLDFNMYHGLYRPVTLVHTDRLGLTDPILADRPASGGVFARTLRASPASALVRVQAHVRNGHAEARVCRVRATLRGPDGSVAAAVTSEPVPLGPGAEREVAQDLEVRRPRLWSPAEPHLHELATEVLTDAGAVDAERTRIGIRRIAVSREGFSINGRRMFLRGANRHQEYPYVGYALSDAAQYRDARKIKEAGFDYVRLSHYAHAPAFMDACDELGLVVMNCIPGWQYFNPDPAFAELQYRNCRDLVRRDRNHPCVILWEVSLNESAMPPEFVTRTHAIAHEEYPGDQCFTAGWVKGYDVFIRARQHGGCRRDEDRPCLVSEYGDWEYYAMNAGLDQDAWADLTPAESNSRQLRWQGERALLQQATNMQEAHDDNLGGVGFGDGLWVMFDYNRGYAPDVESSGCMDLFRLPKYGYHFFRSQRSPGEAGAVVFIASEWTAASATDVRVFSNCEEVALLLDGRLLERRPPDRGRTTRRLAHPPFTFRTGGFRPGALEAVGYLGGRPAARHAVRTPEAPAALGLAFDLSGRPRDRAHRDVLFCYASLRDAHGTVVPAWENVAFGVTGGGILVGANPFATEAGIASILLETAPGAPPAAVHALALVPEGGAARVLSASLGLEAPAPAHQVRVTTDGSEPGPGSERSPAVVPAGPGLRVGLLVEGRVVTTLAWGAPRLRIPPSAPPERREPFHR